MKSIHKKHMKLYFIKYLGLEGQHWDVVIQTISHKTWDIPVFKSPFVTPTSDFYFTTFFSPVPTWVLLMSFLYLTPLLLSSLLSTHSPLRFWLFLVQRNLAISLPVLELILLDLLVLLSPQLKHHFFFLLNSAAYC